MIKNINLSYNDIKLFYQISKEANEICDSDSFWQQKMIYNSNKINEIIPFIKGKMEQMYINNSTVWLFGYNRDGQLGLGDDKYISTMYRF